MAPNKSLEEQLAACESPRQIQELLFEIHRPSGSMRRESDGSISYDTPQSPTVTPAAPVQNAADDGLLHEFYLMPTGDIREISGYSPLGMSAMRRTIELVGGKRVGGNTTTNHIPL